MRQRAIGLILGAGVLVALTLMLVFPPAMAGAFQQATPTPGGLGGGLTQGLGQPTATPVATEQEPVAGGLPALSDADLEALNLAAEDVPAAFAANRAVESFSVSAVVEQLRAAAPDLADIMQALSDDYGWTHSIQVSYTACEPTVPVASITSEVAQMGGPEQARAFIDDPRVETLYETLGYTVVAPSEALPVHGLILIMGNQVPACFDAETEYSLGFDYQGMLLNLSLIVNAETDRALVESLFAQLVPMMTAKVGALAGGALDATALPTEAAPTETAVPTETEAIPPTTAPQATPKPTLGGLFFGATATPSADVEDSATLERINAIMPTTKELALPQPPFALNEALSGIFTLDELVADAENNGLIELAAAIQAAGSATGLAGEVARLWDVGSECPNTPGLSVESDVTVFPSAEAAQTYLADEGIRQAWLNMGAFTSYEIEGNVITARGALPDYGGCGPAALYAQVITHGRFTITALVIAASSASEADMVSVVETLNQYIASKLDAAEIG